VSSIEAGLRTSRFAIATNLVLAIVKIAAGILGNSYALVADGIESTTDIFSSLVVWSGLRISARPPDRNHPFGHGKAESIAGVVVSVMLLGAALLIAIQSVLEIRHPQHLPAPFTLAVLVGVIAVKETLFRFVRRVGSNLASRALMADAWHHRSDALTSAAAFVGISIALVGGEGYGAADDWAALFACVVIFFNGIRLLRPALDDMMDAAAPPEIEEIVREMAASVEGVHNVEKCRIRKSGILLLMDIHVRVDGEIPVRKGHDIAHAVKDRLVASHLPIADVVVHIEPDGPPPPAGR